MAHAGSFLQVLRALSGGGLHGCCWRSCPPCGSGGDRRGRLPWPAGSCCPSLTPASLPPSLGLRPPSPVLREPRLPSPPTPRPAGQEGSKSRPCWASGAGHSTSALGSLLCSVRDFHPPHGVTEGEAAHGMLGVTPGMQWARGHYGMEREQPCVSDSEWLTKSQQRKQRAGGLRTNREPCGTDGRSPE